MKSLYPQKSVWLNSSFNTAFDTGEGTIKPSKHQRSDWLKQGMPTSSKSQISNETKISDIHVDSVSTLIKDNADKSKASRWGRLGAYLQCCYSCCTPLLLGLLLGLLTGGIFLAIVLPTVLLSKNPTTTPVANPLGATTVAASTTTVTTGSTVSLTTVTTKTTSTSTSASTSRTTTTTSTTPTKTTTSSTKTTTTTATTTTTTTTTSTTTTAPTTLACSISAPGHIYTANPASQWQLYSATFVANQTTYILAVGFTNSGSGQSYFDMISAVDTSAPSVELLKNGDFQNSSVTWEYWQLSCLIACTGKDDGGTLLTSGCNGGTGDHCFKGSCSTGYLFLSQTFSTVIGNTYQVSFMAGKTGSATSIEISVY